MAGNKGIDFVAPLTHINGAMNKEFPLDDAEIIPCTFPENYRMFRCQFHGDGIPSFATSMPVEVAEEIIRLRDQDADIRALKLLDDGEEG